MHRVEKMERLLAEAEQRGFIVRLEWLGGRGGGACEIKGRQHLFVDLALSTAEQLAQIEAALPGQSTPASASRGQPGGAARAA